MTDEEPPGWLDDEPEPTRAPTRITTARTIPYDLEAEADLLGACLTQRAAITTAHEHHITAATFYKPAHARIWAAIDTLHDRDDPVDPTTVAHELGDHLELAGGRQALLGLVGNAGIHHGAYARIIAGHAHARDVLRLSEAITRAVYDGDDPAALVDELARHTDTAALAETSSWHEIDLVPILTGQTATVIPTLLTRHDGQALLYPGRVHAFNAEPEAGKSWLALSACLQSIDAGAHALYVDFEDHADSVVERLVALGANPDLVAERFHYIRPDDPIDHHARALITTIADTHPVAIAIIDGVAEAMAMSGWDENANRDAVLFYTALPRHLTRHGMTVVLIDHVVKDKDSQGRYARGAGGKLGGIDGATFKLENVKRFGRGLDGMTKLIIGKDRPGWLRHLGPTVAEMRVHSDEDGTHVTVELHPSSTPTVDSDAPFRPTTLMERVSMAIAASGTSHTSTAVTQMISKSRKQHVLTALTCLVDEGYVTREAGPHNALIHTHARAYREIDDPRSARFEPLDEPPDQDQEMFDDDTF